MAKPATTKKPDRTRTKVQIKHEFTVEEYKERTTELTSSMKSVELKDEQVKATVATAKAEIKEMKSHVNDLANQLRNGYEMRDVDALVEFNRKKGVKKFYHFAPGNSEINGKFIREEAMSEEDFAELPIDKDTPSEPQPPKEAPQQTAGQQASMSV